MSSAKNLIIEFNLCIRECAQRGSVCFLAPTLSVNAIKLSQTCGETDTPQVNFFSLPRSALIVIHKSGAKKIRSRVPSLRRDDKLFEKIGFFNVASVSQKIRFFEKIGFLTGASVSKKIRFFEKIGFLTAIRHASVLIINNPCSYIFLFPIISNEQRYNKVG
jgi:hypothetical protein